MTMVRHATRKHAAEKWQDEGVCPNILRRLAVLKKDSRGCQAYTSQHRWEYEVSDGNAHLLVSLKDRTCACGLWQISGIPCKHGIRAILFAGLEPADYVSPYYSVKTYNLAYDLPIDPLADVEQWPPINAPTLEPPTLKRSIGRTSRKRTREEQEQRKRTRRDTEKCNE